MKVRISIIAVTALIVAGSVAHATTFTNAPAGLVNPSEYVDFSGLAAGTDVSTTYAAQGITFAGLQAETTFPYPDAASEPGATNFDPTAVTPQITDPVTFSFSSPVSALSFYAVTDGGATVTSYLDGAPVETLSLLANSVSNGFYGFTNTSIDEIVITVAGDQRLLVDDIGFNGAVPEPATLALLASGFAGLGVIRRRKKA